MGASCYACVGGNNMKNEIQRLQGIFSKSHRSQCKRLKNISMRKVWSKVCFENIWKADPQQIIVGTPGRVFDMITRKVSRIFGRQWRQDSIITNFLGYQSKRHQNLRSWWSWRNVVPWFQRSDLWHFQNPSWKHSGLCHRTYIVQHIQHSFRSSFFPLLCLLRFWM